MTRHVDSNPAWTNTPGTPITADTLEDIEAVLDESHPFAGLRPDKLYMSQMERVSVAQGAEQTLLNVNGPGVVRTLWLAVPSNAAMDGRLRIYYDGSATAAVDIDLGTLFATHYGAGARGPGEHHNQRLSAQVNSGNLNSAYLFQYPMPFGTSIRIAFYNPDASTAGGFYSMAAYHLYPTDRAQGLRLRVAGARLDQAVTVTNIDSFTLASINTGPGWIVGHSYVGGFGSSTQNMSWLERDIQIAVDGEATPTPGTGTQVVATGTEDWFDSAWYYNGWTDFASSTNSYVGQDFPNAGVAPFVAAMTTDLWSKWGGVPFQNSCLVSLLSEAACTTGHSFSYAILYYGP